MPAARKKTTRKTAKKPAARTANKKTSTSASKRSRPHTSAHLKKAFLERYRDVGNVRAASDSVGVGRRTIYDWLAADPEFKAAFDGASEDAADLLEHIAWRRATVGHHGKPPSDTLIIFLLKGLRPAKYCERFQHEVGGLPDGQPFTIQLVRESDNGRLEEITSYDEIGR